MNRSTVTFTLRAVGVAFVATLAATACTNETAPPSASNSSALTGGSGTTPPHHSTVTSKGGGDGDGDGDDGYGYSYAFAKRAHEFRHHLFELASGDRSVNFTWRAVAGVSPAADLAVDASGRTILQIASVDNAPFARVGLEAVPLRAGEEYRIELSASGGAVYASLVDSSGAIVIEGHATSNAVADVVLPGEFYRAAILSAQLQ